MKIILMQDVTDLGAVGDVVDVADGYGRNYLLPRGLAIVATTKNKRQMEHERRLREHHIIKVRQNAQTLAQRLQQHLCQFTRKAGEEGRLFGSVTSIDIAESLHKAGFEIDRRRIQLDQPVKSLGQFEVPIRLHTDVVAMLKVNVAAEE